MGHYQRLFKQVTAQNQPIILVTKQGEQVALISVQALAEFTRLQEEASDQALLILTQKARKLTAGQDLPPDLSTRHDAYLWKTNE